MPIPANDDCPEDDGQCVWIDVGHPYCRQFSASVQEYYGDPHRWTGMIPDGAVKRWIVRWSDFETVGQDAIFDDFAEAWRLKGELDREHRSSHWETIYGMTREECDDFWYKFGPS